MKVLGASYTAQNMEMVSSAQGTLSSGHCKKIGGVPWCGTNTEKLHLLAFFSSR